MEFSIDDLNRRRDSQGTQNSLGSQVSRFCHVPLPGEKYIRLLHIIDSENERISITLEVFPLSQQLPPYEALSYTWGKAVCADGQEDDLDPGTSHEIIVNGNSFTITENLYVGLMELRKDVVGYLWVDALCIDQMNAAERCSQLLLMGDIYSTADNVVIWLGKEISEVNDVLWLMEKYLPVAEAEGWGGAHPKLLNLLGMSMRTWWERWEACRRFYTSYRWFSRAWVVQELLLARRIIMRCGGRPLDLDSLSRKTRLCYDLGLPAYPDSVRFFNLTCLREMLRDESLFVRHMTFLCSSSGAVTPEERWYTWLMFLVDFIRSQRSGRRHDKLYAIFGLAHISRPHGLQHVKALAVNYEQSAEKAFMMFASETLLNTPKLEFLSLVDPLNALQRRECHTLPSWCPDLDTRRHGVSLTRINMALLDKSQKYKASGYLENIHSCSIKGRILTLTGKRVATVTKVEHEAYSALAFDSRFFPTGEGYFGACSCLDHIYSLTGEDRVEVLWRTLLANCDTPIGTTRGSQHPVAANFSPNFAAFITLSSAIALLTSEDTERSGFLKVLRAREEEYKTSNVVLAPLSTILELVKTEVNWPDRLVHWGFLEGADTFALPAGQIGVGRRLFVTSQKWLGLGPLALEQDDEVWLFKNADVPFILRPCGNSQYTLVGETYVHGIMHGELIDMPGGKEGFHDIEIV